jgi:ribose-phosphate pyrophosphokinase
LINNLKCDRVTIVDPHSEVTPALLDNCHVVTQAEILQTSLLAKRIREENWALIAPDAGAEKKIHEVAKSISSDDFTPDIYCACKLRDTKTGRITATTFHGDVERRKVLIVDDICDGGRTFIELAKVLQDKGSKEIYLYVTHGIFSKGLEPLKLYFKQIYCYHTMLPVELQESNYLTILSAAEGALN